jgi:hypothetical protein
VAHGNNERLLDTFHLHHCISAVPAVVGYVDDQTLKEIVAVQVRQDGGGLRVIHVAGLKMDPTILEFHVSTGGISRAPLVRVFARAVP